MNKNKHFLKVKYYTSKLADCFFVCLFCKCLYASCHQGPYCFIETHHKARISVIENTDREQRILIICKSISNIIWYSENSEILPFGGWGNYLVSQVT